MDALPRLRLIACTGAGYDGVDVEYAQGRGIAVTNSPCATGSSVADLAVELLINSVRGVADANEKLLRHGFMKPWPARRGLTGRRIGIYGFGSIGQAVARRLQGFEVEIAYTSRSLRLGSEVEYRSSLLSLAEWSDALILCVPANDQTIGSVNGPILTALGSEGHLVNVARGAVVDTPALCRALRAGTVAGAALDVFDPDFLPDLIALPQVFLTPHIGGSTIEAEAAMQESVLANVEAHFLGRRFPSPVGDARGQKP
jgi:lactate dehydrogenase-like 2-hydroxyacid dehydrogenase